jgi:hypothetical protein
MFLSVTLAVLAATATPAETSAPPAVTPAASTAKPRKICRSEAVIGSITPKRVCTIVAPRAPVQGSGQATDQQRPAQAGAGSGN